MKILLLSQFFSTTRGGGEHVFSLIAKNLAENGHHVWVITNKIVDEHYDTHNNVKIIFVPPTLEYGGGLPPGFIDNIRYTTNAIMAGLQVIRNEGIDLIHSNNFAPALCGTILSYLTSKPHITTIHDVFSLCGKNYWEKWGRQSGVSKVNVILAPIFEKILVRMKQDCIHTVSESTRDDLMKFGAKKPICVIHNSIDYASSSQKKSTSMNRFQFAYVGRLVFYKNLEVLIRAIEIARTKEPDIKLMIVGGGPHKKNLEEMVTKLGLEPNIEFKGYVSHEEKNEIIASSMALLFPSLCEGFGLVILESFAQNRPVLVSNVRPMSDIVSNNKTGFVLDPHDEKVWANHILRIIENPNEASAMGKKGFDVLQILFNQELMYQKIIKMYTEVLSRRK